MVVDRYGIPREPAGRVRGLISAPSTPLRKTSFDSPRLWRFSIRKFEALCTERGGFQLVDKDFMDILGISAFYHDRAACLVRNGEILAAAQEERFTRKKHDSAFPRKAVEYCLETGGVELADLTYIVFYDKPLLKFERLLDLHIVRSERHTFLLDGDAALDQREGFS